MQGSPHREATAEAPPSAPPYLSRGHRVLIEADVIDAFVDECQVSFSVGNLRTSVWMLAKDVIAIVGYDPRLAEIQSDRLAPFHNHLRQRDAAEKEAR